MLIDITGYRSKLEGPLEKYSLQSKISERDPKKDLALSSSTERKR
jgi:hypothetical protein